MTVRVAGRSICQEKVNLKPLLDAETFLTVAVIYDDVWNIPQRGVRF